MARTALDIATPILDELKRLQEKERKSLGQLVSELVAQALAERARGKVRARPFHWNVSPGRLRVDVDDKDATAAVADAKPRGTAR